MSVFYDIGRALRKQLNAMTSLPPIAWENKKYTPIVGTLFLRPTNITGDTVQASLGDSGTDETVGIYQIDVFSPADKGDKAASQMADNVANKFKRGTVMSYNGRNVRVINVSRQVGITNNDGWYQVSVVITYKAFTQPRV